MSGGEGRHVSPRSVRRGAEEDDRGDGLGLGLSWRVGRPAWAGVGDAEWIAASEAVGAVCRYDATMNTYLPIICSCKYILALNPSNVFRPHFTITPIDAIHGALPVQCYQYIILIAR